MCPNWPLIAGIAASVLVWVVLLKLAAYGYGLFFLRQYVAQMEPHTGAGLIIIREE
jgi:hypothetical protein